eukprot:3231357-Pleurochrysis_carterae.AAC.4
MHTFARELTRTRKEACAVTHRARTQSPLRSFLPLSALFHPTHLGSFAIDLNLPRSLPVVPALSSGRAGKSGGAYARTAPHATPKTQVPARAAHIRAHTHAHHARTFTRHTRAHAHACPFGWYERALARAVARALACSEWRRTSAGEKVRQGRWRVRMRASRACERSSQPLCATNVRCATTRPDSMRSSSAQVRASRQ